MSSRAREDWEEEEKEDPYDVIRRGIDEIEFTGDYVQLIREILGYVFSARRKTKYFRLLMLRKLYAYIQTKDIYLLAFQRVLEMVRMATEEETNRKKTKKEKKKEEKRKRVAKFEAKRGHEPILVFGNKHDRPKPKLYFADAEFLGFGESYDASVKSSVGTEALKKAVHQIFDKIRVSPRSCVGWMFTIVLMVCEGSRFRPIFDYCKNVEYETPEPWVGDLVQDWEKYSKKARQHTGVFEYNPNEKLTQKIVKEREDNFDWAFAMLAILHGFCDDPIPPIERRRGGSSMMGDEFECCLQYFKEHGTEENTDVNMFPAERPAVCEDEVGVSHKTIALEQFDREIDEHMAAEPIEEEELEPLFDYTRVQPINIVSLDDDDDDDDVRCLVPSKRSKSNDSSSTGEKVQVDAKVVDLDNGKDGDDDFWLNPPKLVVDKTKPVENSTVKELRQKQQELLSITESAKAIVQVDHVTRDLKSSMDSASESPVEKHSKPAAERLKIVISIQDKDGQKQFRVYMDDMFERLFKMYADKAKLKVENLVFCFDGDKVDPTATPSSLEMEDGDMIEVNVKSS